MQFTPLHDRVVVRRIEGEEKTKGGLIIPDTAKEKPSEGEVIAVGEGARKDSGELIPVCAWVDGEYGISGVYLGVEAEIGREGVKRVVERDLTDTERAGLEQAAEAVRAKQADVAGL